MLALGNIFYAAIFTEKEKADRFLSLSMTYDRKVLELDEYNIYAANGVGIALAGTFFLERNKKMMFGLDEKKFGL